MILIFLKLFKGKFTNGPPDAVINILSILLLSELCNPYQIDKCSESTGIKFVLFFFNSFEIKFQAIIIDSLLAIAIFFLYFIIFKSLTF